MKTNGLISNDFLFQSFVLYTKHNISDAEWKKTFVFKKRGVAAIQSRVRIM